MTIVTALLGLAFVALFLLGWCAVSLHRIADTVDRITGVRTDD